MRKDYNIKSFPLSSTPSSPTNPTILLNITISPIISNRHLQPPPPQTNEAVWHHEMEEGGDVGEKETGEYTTSPSITFTSQIKAKLINKFQFTHTMTMWRKLMSFSNLLVVDTEKAT
ncbi:hypothetical protein AAZV13_17G136300 [Glycine max]